MTRVIIHLQGDGSLPDVYVEGDAEVIWVSDMTPDDRFFRMSNRPIPDDLAADLRNGPISQAGDDPAKDVRAHTALAEMNGEPHLKPVD